MKKLLALIFSLFAIQAMAETPFVSKVWVGDNGDGTYSNPIIYSDYSDPDVCRVGDDYYMTASSFNCIPGLPNFTLKRPCELETGKLCLARSKTIKGFQ